VPTWILIFVVVEGFLVFKWKDKIDKQGFNSKKDNLLISQVTRLNYILILVKTSLLPLPEYIIIMLPVTTFFLILMERQLTTDYWKNVISPRMINIAQSLESDNKIPRLGLSRDEIVTEIRGLGKKPRIFMSLLVIIFIGSLSFPSFWGWFPKGSVFGLPFGFLLTSESNFYPEYLAAGANILVILSVIIIVIGILLPLPSECKRISIVSTWIVRLLVIRSCLMITTYVFSPGIYTPFLFLLIFLLIIYEFWTDQSLNHFVVSALNYFSQRETFPDSGHSVLTSTNTLVDKKQPVTQPQAVAPQVASIPSTSPPVYSVHEDKTKSGFFSVLGRIIGSTFALIVTGGLFILKPIFTISKAIFAALLLLIASCTEVFLLLFAIMTGFSPDGSILIPTYSFNLYTGRIYSYGGFPVWSWYILGILILQIFLLVIAEWYQYLTKKPEGIIIIVFRWLSRLLLLLLVLGSSYQLIGFGDSYALLRLFIMTVLFFFMEITSLKIRIERKHWQNNDTKKGEGEIQNSIHTKSPQETGTP
jgi:hypothetical protein